MWIPAGQEPVLHPTLVHSFFQRLFGICCVVLHATCVGCETERQRERGSSRSFIRSFARSFIQLIWMLCVTWMGCRGKEKKDNSRILIWMRLVSSRGKKPKYISVMVYKKKVMVDTRQAVWRRGSLSGQWGRHLFSSRWMGCGQIASGKGTSLTLGETNFSLEGDSRLSSQSSCSFWHHTSQKLFFFFFCLSNLIAM